MLCVAGFRCQCRHRFILFIPFVGNVSCTPHRVMPQLCYASSWFHLLIYGLRVCVCVSDGNGTIRLNQTSSIRIGPTETMNWATRSFDYIICNIYISHIIVGVSQHHAVVVCRSIEPTLVSRSLLRYGLLYRIV